MSDNNIPKHIAIIPDGNRRFAKKKSMLPWEGHRSGAKVFEKLLDWCKEFDIKELSFWAASTENLEREKKEVDFLIKLFDETCNKFLKDNEKDNKNKIRIRFIGDLNRLPSELREKMKKIEELTKDNQDYKLNMLVAYGGKWEITEAAKKIAKLVKRGELAVENIEPDVFMEELELQNPPDLIIRTGQARLSGLLPWQSGYSEIIFLEDKLWPEFTKEDFKDCLDKFSKIKRNFGK